MRRLFLVVHVLPLVTRGLVRLIGHHDWVPCMMEGQLCDLDNAAKVYAGTFGGF